MACTPAAHGVNVAQRIGGSDLAENERVVDQRGKEIDRLHEGGVRRDPIDARIVRCLETDQQVRIALLRKPRQHSG
jgi:hypothetical protein